MCLRGVPILRAYGSRVDAGLPSKLDRSFAKPAVENRLIGVNAPVAEERPVAASLFGFLRVAFDDKDFFFFAPGFRCNLAKGIGDERVAPEFEAGIAVGGIPFKANAIHNSHVCSIRNRMGSLNRAPGLQLSRAEFGLFLQMPANTRRIKDDLRAAEGG